MLSVCVYALPYLGGPLEAAAAGLAGAALGAAAAAGVAVTWPERSALFLVFMSSVTLRRPDVTAVPWGTQQGSRRQLRRDDKPAVYALPVTCLNVGETVVYTAGALSCPPD